MNARSLLGAMTRRDFGWTALVTAMSARLGHAAQMTGAVSPPSHADAWRDMFPALQQRVQGHPLVYLDSAATTQRPLPVLEAVMDFYRRDNANPGAALHELARRANERYEAARRTLATFVNAASPAEIVWVRGTTEGVNLVATAWARPRLRRGDEILLTLAEHASNLLPWRLAAEATGARVRFVDLDDEGRISLDDLDRKLSERTRLVAFSHVSNVAGYVHPAAEICMRARRAGARVLIDAAQSAPHVPLDVQAIGCDFLTFSSHKMLGPMGVGVLWARSETLEEMAPYQAGSNMAHDVDVDQQTFEHAARKFGAGTPNVSGPLGMAAAVQCIASLGRREIERHEAALTAYALERLSQAPGLKLIGPKAPQGRIPVFSFTLPTHTPQQILQRLDAQGIAIRAGDLAALPLLKRFGVTAAARASCYLYTSMNDIDRFVDALLALSAGSRK
jgi:cysteine desulfurase / selenocysteine lyase